MKHLMSLNMTTGTKLNVAVMQCGKSGYKWISLPPGKNYLPSLSQLQCLVLLIKVTNLHCVCEGLCSMMSLLTSYSTDL